MLKIIAMPKINGNASRRKVFKCEKCGTGNWFDDDVPLICQGTSCNNRFHDIRALLDKKETVMVHHYREGII